MKRAIVIDSGPLGDIVHPKLRPDVAKWLQFIKAEKIALRVAEISDYELRRNFLLEGLQKSVNNLQKFRQTKRFIPITSLMMIEAAELWAWLRQRGQATAGDKTLDGDVILAAQALSLKDSFDEIILSLRIQSIDTDLIVLVSRFGIGSKP